MSGRASGCSAGDWGWRFNRVERNTVPDIIVAAIILVTVAFFAWPRSEWPNVVVPDNAAPVVRRHTLGWKKTPVERLGYFHHDPHGLYLHRGPIVACKPGEDEVDAAPHPSRVVQCGLKAYGMMIETKGRPDEVRLYADRLISLQDEVGLFRFRAGNASAQTRAKA